jgi:hypothetical protein
MEYRDLQRESVDWAAKAFGWNHNNEKNALGLGFDERSGSS